MKKELERSSGNSSALSDILEDEKKKSPFKRKLKTKRTITRNKFEFSSLSLVDGEKSKVELPPLKEP